MKRKFTENGAIIAILLLLVVPNSAWATMTFNVHACTDSQPCVLGAGGSGSAAGPTNSDFINFFDSRLGEPPSPGDSFFWDIVGTSKDGYVIGDVESFCCGGVFTTYIFFQGNLLCCTLDEPYSFVSINDNNLIIGYTAYGTNGPFDNAFIADAVGGGSGEAEQLDYALSQQANNFFSALGPDSFYNTSFSAIDNDNRILAATYSDTSGYVPFELVPAPEPTTLTLFGAGLIGAAAMRRRSASRGSS